MSRYQRIVDPIRLHAIHDEVQHARPKAPPRLLPEDHASLVEDPVVDVALPRLELLGALRVVDHHAVDDNVGIESERLVEVAEQLREIGRPATAVPNLPIPGAGCAQQPLEHARVRVRLLHPLALGEGVAEHNEAAHTRPLRAEREVAKPVRVVPGLHRVGRPRGEGVVAPRREREVAGARLRSPEVDVEIGPGVGGVAVEQESPVGAHDASDAAEPLRRDVEQPEHGLREQGRGDDAQRCEAGPEEGLPQRCSGGLHVESIRGSLSLAQAGPVLSCASDPWALEHARIDR
jgi:hypothetical protein